MDFSGLPEPVRPATTEPYGILVTGIGGTGVVTIGALLGMAAHTEGKGTSVLDMTGLAQKNGAVVSHVRIADSPDQLYATRIAAGERSSCSRATSSPASATRPSGRCRKASPRRSSIPRS
jgi:hypothetical protein